MAAMGHFVSAPATLPGLILTLTAARPASVSMIGPTSRCVDRGNVMSLENAPKIINQGRYKNLFISIFDDFQN